MAGEVRIASPPKAVLRIGNPIGRYLLKSRLGTRMTGQALLRFHGRKTGATYTVVVSWHELGDSRVFLSPYRWRYNFTGGAPLTVRHRGVDLQGRGILDDEPGHVAEVVNGLLVGGTAQRRLGLKVPDGHRVTSADIAAINYGLVRFEPATGNAQNLASPDNG